MGPILEQVGAIDENRVDEALEQITRLLQKAIRDVKAKHGPEKRVRIFLSAEPRQLQGTPVQARETDAPLFTEVADVPGDDLQL